MKYACIYIFRGLKPSVQEVLTHFMFYYIKRAKTSWTFSIFFWGQKVFSLGILELILFVFMSNTNIYTELYFFFLFRLTWIEVKKWQLNGIPPCCKNVWIELLHTHFLKTVLRSRSRLTKASGSGFEIWFPLCLTIISHTYCMSKK